MILTTYDDGHQCVVGRELESMSCSKLRSGELLRSSTTVRTYTHSASSYIVATHGQAGKARQGKALRAVYNRQ